MTDAQRACLLAFAAGDEDWRRDFGVRDDLLTELGLPRERASLMSLVGACG